MKPLKRIFCTVITLSLFASTVSAQPLAARFETIARAAQGRVGVSAILLETGETASLNGRTRFPMQSVYKLPIAMAVMRKVDAKRLNLEQKISVKATDYVQADSYSPLRDQFPNGVTLPLRSILERALAGSDNSASDIVLRLAGGPQAVTQMLRNLGFNEIIVADSEAELAKSRTLQYRNYATPDAMAKLLRAVHQGRGLSAGSRAELLRIMKATPHGARQLKGLLPIGTVVAHKTGSSGTHEGITAATNDVGIITLKGKKHVAIAVFVADSRADKATRERIIAQVARAVWERWNR